MLFSVVFLVVSYIFPKLFVFRANKLPDITEEQYWYFWSCFRLQFHSSILVLSKQKLKFVSRRKSTIERSHSPMRSLLLVHFLSIVAMSRISKLFSVSWFLIILHIRIIIYFTTTVPAKQTLPMGQSDSLPKVHQWSSLSQLRRASFQSDPQ